MVTNGTTQRFEDWNLFSSSSRGSISTYNSREQKEVKKGKNIEEGFKHTKSSPGVVTAEKSRAQVTSTRNTITHHTGTDEIRAKKPSLTLILGTNGLKITFEPLPVAGLADCLQGLDRI
ncbi:hypothetical protein J6590_027444 [Homalodisca vitripennis]|nr:hypothetical protein J6590_027444 [Homalodisca vitripennis]